jgi:hypothetical protein
LNSFFEYLLYDSQLAYLHEIAFFIRETDNKMNNK